MNFKAFLGLTKKQPKAKPTIDRDEAEFEREIVFNDLVKRGFSVRKNDWNLLTGLIERRFSWGAFIGGSEGTHSEWDFAYVDMTDPPPAETVRREELTAEQLLRSLESLRSFAQRTAKK